MKGVVDKAVQASQSKLRNATSLQVWELLLSCLDKFLDADEATEFNGAAAKDRYLRAYGSDPGEIDFRQVRGRVLRVLRNNGSLLSQPKQDTGGLDLFNQTNPSLAAYTSHHDVDRHVRSVLANIKAAAETALDKSRDGRFKEPNGRVANVTESRAGENEVASTWERDSVFLLRAWNHMWKAVGVPGRLQNIRLTAQAAAMVLKLEEMWENVVELIEFLSRGALSARGSESSDHEVSVIRNSSMLLFSTIPSEYIQPFVRPVNHTETSRYAQLVQDPTDFTTIAHNLCRGHYADVNAVYGDISRIWGKFMPYQADGDPLIRAALSLKPHLERVWKEMNVEELWEGVDRQVSRAQGASLERTLLAVGKALSKSREEATQMATTQAATTAPSSGKAGVESDFRRAQKLVMNLTGMIASAPFMERVPHTVPGYSAIVDYPMYFNAILTRIPSPGRRKLKAGPVYQDVYQIDRDVRQIFHNCDLFNPPGTPLSHSSALLRGKWEVIWKNSFSSAGNTTSTMDRARARLKVREWSDTLDMASEDARWKLNASEVLRKVMVHPLAAAFNVPLNPSFVRYYQVVAHPIDLSSIMRALKAHVIPAQEQVKQHLNLVWNNSFAFNPNNSALYNASIELRNLTNKLWASHGLKDSNGTLPLAHALDVNLRNQGIDSKPHQQAAPSEYPALSHISERSPSPWVPPVATSLGGRGRERSISRGRLTKMQMLQQSQKTFPPPPPGWKATAHAMLEELMNCSCSYAFLDPVPDETPHYYEKIAYPMDLRTVAARLDFPGQRDGKQDPRLVRRDLFRNPAEFRDAISQIWKNCRAFNEMKSKVRKLGDQMAALWSSLWRNSEFFPDWGTASGDLRFQEAFREGQLGYEEKMHIAKRVMALDEDSAGGIVAMLAPHRIDEPEYQLDIDSLKPSELLRLRSYLDYVAPEVPTRAPTRHPADPYESREAKLEKLGYVANNEQRGTSRPGSGGESRHGVTGHKPRDPSRPARVKLPPELTKIKAFLTGFRKRREAWAFNEPVDPIKAGVPTYFQVIRNPMDLGTIEKKMSSGEYKDGVRGLLRFRDDIRLVFQNCRTFNPPDNLIAKNGETLSRSFESWWRKSGFENKILNTGAAGEKGVPSNTLVDAPSQEPERGLPEQKMDIDSNEGCYEDGSADGGDDEDESGESKPNSQAKFGESLSNPVSEVKEDGYVPMFDDATVSEA
eukprot:CAMPEP_0184504822 /NCGR_PEP_ID=MMETSP0113_2-20130426/52664_1 /TAXON_ID=91329 /ORGANISM="Norrisiella sphaerica, Strain BC52" /LENGTH=1204 /DNA_ID=CAMNT_0026894481 /DNA_START=239 /DNA_END=3853 /DNA_ORIENTATION=-